MKEKIDEEVSVEEFSNVVEKLQDQASLNDEMDRVNKHLIQENEKLNGLIRLRKEEIEQLEKDKLALHS